MSPRTLALAASLAVLAGCAPRLQGDGVATVVERAVPAFAALEVRGPIEVEVQVTPGATPSMHLEGDENLVSLVGWLTVGDALQVDARGLSPAVPLRMRLVTPALGEVASADGAHVFVTGAAGGRVSLKASAAGRLHAQALDCDALLLDARSGARVEAAGTARLVEAHASESSDVVAVKVRARVAWVLADSLSTIHVHASEAVRGRALRASQVRVHGAPALDDVEQPGRI